MDILQIRELKQSLERRDARILELERQLEAARPATETGEAVAYLCDGMRFKVGHHESYGVAITGLPLSLNGQWVALVDATDDKHMRAHPPAADARILELEEKVRTLEGCARISKESQQRRQDRIATLEVQLTASREREGRMRELGFDDYAAILLRENHIAVMRDALEKMAKAKTNSHTHGWYIQLARDTLAALAAEKGEKE